MTDIATFDDKEEPKHFLEVITLILSSMAQRVIHLLLIVLAQARSAYKMFVTIIAKLYFLTLK